MEDARQAHARALLATAHAHIGQGNGPGALEQWLDAVQLLWGSEGRVAAAEQFRASFMERGQTTDELSVLAAQLASISLTPNSSMRNIKGAEATGATTRSAPILEARYPTMNDAGKEVLQRAQDESFVCDSCGGVVANSRRDQHQLQWCPGRGREGT
jgi:hypothetical protein